MEGSPHSEQGGTASDPRNEGQAPNQPGPAAEQPAADQPAGADPGATGGPSPEGTGTGQADPAVGGSHAEVGADAERAPAEDQAPAAHAAATVGDPGLHGEQNPVQAEGGPSHVDRALGTSAAPPSAQSGVPLAEDRAAGIEPGQAGPVAPEGAGEPDAGEPDEFPGR